MKRMRLTTPLACALALAGCDCNGDGPGGAAKITGRIVDLDGNAIAGVAIAGAGGSAISADTGRFELEATAAGEHVVVFTRAGHLAASRNVMVPATGSVYLPVTLMAIAPAQPLDASSGGTITGARGAMLIAPPAAFVDASGAVVTGSVDVALTPFDPSILEEARAYPGPLRGRTLGGEIIPLDSYGVMDITITRAGEVLKVKDGAVVEVKVPAPSEGTPPDTIQMWRYDVANAIWIESAHGGTYESEANAYRAVIDTGVPLDLMLNSDNALRPTCASGTVFDAGGHPVAGAHVSARAAQQRYAWYADQDTDAAGAFCITVEMDSDVVITITMPDGSETTREVHSGTSLTRDYPADCSTASCKQLAPIVAGTPDPGETTEAACGIDAQNNPFAGTCASELGKLYGCYDPQGSCTYEMTMTETGFGYEMVYENGAKMITGMSFVPGGDFGGLEVRYESRTGQVCGTMTSSREDIVVHLPNSPDLTFKMQPTGGMEIECAYGGRVELSMEQLQAMDSCGGAAANVTPVGGAFGDCEPAPGSFLSTCIFDSDCRDFMGEPLECCSSVGVLEGQCLFAGACDMACTSNTDCIGFGHDTICCSNGLFEMCLPVEACM